MKNERIVLPGAYDSLKCRRVLDELKAEYPFINRASAGKSLCSRDIELVSIGDGSEKVLFAAAFHAQETVTAFAALRFIETVCAAFETGGEFNSAKITELLKKRQLVFLPLVNPDGAEIALNGCQTAGRFAALAASIAASGDDDWNANARGVDLNHNFDAGFAEVKKLEAESGITSPAPRRYGGALPHSEPETAAVVKLCERIRPVRAAALHSQGEELYWRYAGFEPPGARQLAAVTAKAVGYRLVENSGLCSHGGFKDWFISRYNRPAFTFELGRGKNPLPVGDYDEIYHRVERALFVFAFAH